MLCCSINVPDFQRKLDDLARCAKNLSGIQSVPVPELPSKPVTLSILSDLPLRLAPFIRVPTIGIADSLDQDLRIRLTPDFLHRCSRFHSANEMFEASGFKIVNDALVQINWSHSACARPF